MVRPCPHTSWGRKGQAWADGRCPAGHRLPQQPCEQGMRLRGSQKRNGGAGRRPLADRRDEVTLTCAIPGCTQWRPQSWREPKHRLKAKRFFKAGISGVVFFFF